MKLCEWHAQVSADLVRTGEPRRDVKRAVAVLARACQDCDTSKPEPEVPARRRGRPGETEPDTRGYMGGV